MGMPQAQREGLQRRIEVSEQHCAEQYAKTEQLRQQLAVAEGEVARLEVASHGLQAADSTKADRIDRLQVHCDDLEDALAELSTACNSKASAVKGLEKECQRLSNQVTRLQGGRPPPTDEEEQLRQQLDRLRSSHAAELQQLQQACEQQVAWQVQEHEARVLELQQGHSAQLEHVRVAVGIAERNHQQALSDLSARGKQSSARAQQTLSDMQTQAAELVEGLRSQSAQLVSACQSTLERQLTHHATSVDQVEARLVTAEAQLRRLQPLQLRCRELQRCVSDLEQQLAGVRASEGREAAEWRAEVNSCRQQVEALKRERKDMELSLASCCALEASHRQQVGSALSRSARSRTELVACSSEVHSLLATNAALVHEKASFGQQLAEAETECQAAREAAAEAAAALLDSRLLHVTDVMQLAISGLQRPPRLLSSEGLLRGLPQDVATYIRVLEFALSEHCNKEEALRRTALDATHLEASSRRLAQGARCEQQAAMSALQTHIRRTHTLEGLRLADMQVCGLAPVRRVAPCERGVLQVVARAPVTEVAKPKKRMPSPVKRAMQSLERRMYNRKRKSACATRIKKVLVSATGLMAKPPSSEEEIKPLDTLISEAYSEIDKARVKGILHRNTASRKKARLARARRKVLINAGLFTPAEDHQDYKMYQRLQAKKAASTVA
ncbi:MAG: hypothetical protein WDW36_001764 [Sanguina aurantia]